MRAAERVDWSQVWYPGPTRVFSAEEMERAGRDRPSRTLTTAALFNFALFGFMLLQAAPPAATAALTLLLAVAGLAGHIGAHWLWRRPTRRDLTGVTLIGVALVMASAVAGIGLHQLERGSTERDWVRAIASALSIVAAVVWWFVAVYRSHQIEARLREQAEQQRALDMARQLAAAQIQPHFLYNALASLQHWVQAKDDRAAPMLQALTGFLRATLPLFNRARLALGEEAEVVRAYLEVMRLRLGARLTCAVDVEPVAAAAQLPPGVLLTLVENAVEHGAMVAIGAVHIALRARVTDGRLRLEVADDGPGPAAEAADGVGLANSRARLEQAFGPAARLQLRRGEHGGCTAHLECPLEIS